MPDDVVDEPYVRHDLVYVDDSPIEGKGLFARKKIKKGTELGLMKVKKARGNGPYVLWIDDTDERYRVLCELRYINHGDKPNVAYCDDLTVMALRNIKPGEELLHYYGEEWEGV